MTGTCYDSLSLVRRPVYLAETPKLQRGARMEILSEVLKAVKLDGAMFYNAEFSSPWCARSVDARTRRAGLLAWPRAADGVLTPDKVGRVRGELRPVREPEPIRGQAKG